MVYVADLKPVVFRHKGSTPFLPTNLTKATRCGIIEMWECGGTGIHNGLRNRTLGVVGSTPTIPTN